VTKKQGKTRGQKIKMTCSAGGKEGSFVNEEVREETFGRKESLKGTGGEFAKKSLKPSVKGR